jgi:hypothetical protein
MKLNSEQKSRLLNAAVKIYTGYAALDFFKTREFNSNNRTQKTLLEICKNSI